MFKKKNEVDCAYCSYGRALDGRSEVICYIYGMLKESRYKCKKFNYDPLKRTPEATDISVAFDFSEDDFKIDI